MSCCADGNGRTAPAASQPIEAASEEALREQLAALGRAAAAVLTVLMLDGLTVSLAAEFAAVCDQTSAMALRVAERPVIVSEIDEEMRAAIRMSAGWS